MTDLADALGTDEHEGLEFKRDLSNRDALREAICALANDLPGRGEGILLVGVADDGTPAGLAVGDDELLQVVSMRDDARILPRPVIRVTSESYAGSEVIVVRVTATEYPPMRFDGTVYVRVGPSSRRAGAGEERALSERRRTLDAPFDMRPLHGAGLADLDLELFGSSYLPTAVSADVLEENDRTVEQQLAALRFATAAGTPTVAGVLVTGLDPAAWLPGAYLQFVRYDGIEPDAGVRDEDAVRRNLVNLLGDLDVRLPANLHTRLVENGTREERVPDYPLAALREAAYNALVHRSYESNAPVRLLWFDDRIELQSPGGPFGVVTEDNYRTTCDYRNPTLAEAAKNLGYVNRFGRGIARIERALADNGNPPPVFEINGSQWSVTLHART